MSNFRPIDRTTGFLLPPSVDEWLPERHLARFVVEVIEKLDLSRMTRAYRGSGPASYHPAMLLALLVYGYATGVFSSRKIERATFDSVAFRFIAANGHPDHDTIATFRRRFLKDIERLFVEVLMLAREMGMLKLGTVALDGTKIHANASRHSALSYEHTGKLEAQLKQEVAELLALAESEDRADVPDGMSIPEELAEHAAKLAAREEKARATGKKPKGPPPAPPTPGPTSTDQVNLTDEESRIMRVAGGGFEQSCNAQAVVAAESMLVVAQDVAQDTNDKQQVAPMVQKLSALPEMLDKPQFLLADNGYFSEANVSRCVTAKIAPLISLGRERHHLGWKERFGEDPPPPENPSPLEAMAHRLATREGKRLYALRKQIPEPVFGIIKSVMGFRQFSLRGLHKVKGEWNLVTLAWNVRRMFALAPA
jgi:transposase